MTAAASWLDVAEKGSVLGLRFLFFVCTAFGRSVARLVLKPIVLYYAVFHADARNASRRYLERVYNRPVKFADCYTHLLTFAEVALDRIFFLRGTISPFEIGKHEGFEHLQRARASGRGAILLGAHLGSFEAMRVLADARELPINILTYSRNARMITSLLRSLNPKFAGRVIEVSGLDSMLRIKELVEQGELVAVLGDRADVNEKAVTAEFLGAPARFPTGVYLLAAVLRCPVLLTIGLYSRPNRYDFYCEPFLDSLELPRKGREEAMREHVQRYAKRLEHYCRMAPTNWFNFYDFWSMK